jgi:hypothetical protein
MPSRFILPSALELDELAAYHRDVDAALRLYFSPSAPTFEERFLGEPVNEADRQLELRLGESDVRSAFAVLTSLEATFLIDFERRCRKKLKDKLSRHFRELRKTRGNRVRLDEDILEGWKIHLVGSATLIGELRGAIKFRHWIAHGRYWRPKLGRKYDFNYVHLLADTASGLPFES